ncbi:MAG: hypothetical protein HC842_06595 [Cytophagales bacterium]|nr:hypothetical protein [Cytophagales bacterium]
MVHELLAELRNPEQLAPALERRVKRGLISEEQRTELQQKIGYFLTLPEVQNWLQWPGTVLRERALISPSGQLLVPDLVLLSPHEAVIIDYKTSAEHPEHEAQVKQYSQAVSAMGYKSVSAYLIYLNDLVIKPVGLGA